MGLNVSSSAGQIGPTSDYSTITPLTINGASRQPSSTKNVFVVATVALSPVNDGQNELVNVQVSSDNSAFDTIAEVYNAFDVTGLIGLSGHQDIRVPVSFWVRSGYYYRFTSTGTGTSAVQRLREMTF